MPAVPGFKAAVKEYESDKVKDRVSGGEKLREIFGNRENLLTFQQSASKSGGEGWSVLFHSLFHAVNVEKKAVIKTNATAQGELILHSTATELIIQLINAWRMPSPSSGG
jgi:hypothetical protein